MKNDKRKSLKLVRKTIRKDIQLSLITKLKEVAADMEQGSKKLEKEIEKGSKKLAKKLSKELKISQSLSFEVGKELKGPQASVLQKPANVSKPSISSPKTAQTASRKPRPKAAITPKPVKEEAGTI